MAVSITAHGDGFTATVTTETMAEAVAELKVIGFKFIEPPTT